MAKKIGVDLRSLKGLTGKKQKAAVLIIIAAAIALWLLDDSGLISIDGEDKKSAASENASTSVHFVDVGQGDATLVISDGEAMLVDSGELDDGDTLIKYMKQQDVEKLKYVVITHPHSDHMGEMSDVLKSFDAENIIMPKITGELTPTSSVYRKLLETIKSQNKKITAAKDESFSLGSTDVQLFTTKEEHSDLNNYSVLVKIIHGGNSFLITGDCETEEEKEMLEQGFDLSADVLKAGHHGSSTSSSAEFLKAVDPSYAVISCGTGNKYGHPHDETVAALKKYTGSDGLYITMEDGSVVFRSDGKGLTAETEKGVELNVHN